MAVSKDIDRICLTTNASITQVMACINTNSTQGIALIVDGEGKLLNTLTDGDLRRAILSGLSLDETVESVLEQKRLTPIPKPIVASSGSSRTELLALMRERSVRQIPLVDGEGRVVDLVTMSNLQPTKTEPLHAVIMAGGIGSRLRPLTNEIPKPMLPVGGRPLLERTIEQLRDAGVRRVNITTHYKAEKIIQHFGDGSKFDIDLRYVSEDQPLGTAGALALIENIEEPTLVINGDILTRIDFRAMLNFHTDCHADLTVGVRKYDLQVPYGVVECDGVNVTDIVEKPLIKLFVNSGVYLMQPSVHKYIPRNTSFDMTDLIKRLVQGQCSVVSFPIHEYWLDIGQIADYEQAQKDINDSNWNI